LIATIFLVSSLQTKIVSSANWIILTTIILFTTLIPSNIPLLSACLIALANPSSTMRNKKGVRGSPYLNPLLGTNWYVGLPLTKIEIEDDSKHALIHLFHTEQKPNLSSMYIMEVPVD